MSVCACVCLLSWLKYYEIKTVNSIDKIVNISIVKRRYNKLKHMSHIKLVVI